VQLLLLLLDVFLPIALNVYVWRRLRRMAVGDTTAPWRKSVAYVALATSSLAYAIPWAGFIYMYLLLHRGRAVSADEMINGQVVVEVSIALAALSLVLSPFGPKYVRVQLMISAVTVGLFWLSIPLGVL
jgi:hypothetical protein